MGEILTESNLGEILLIVGGAPMGGVLGDHGANGSIKITRNGENWNNSVGRSGEVVRSKSNDKTATAEITFNQTSPFNSVLGTLDRLGLPFSFLCKDPRNGSTFRSNTAQVQKNPEVEFSNAPTDRVWQLFLPDLDENH
jgi:hypothetical protein